MSFTAQAILEAAQQYVPLHTFPATPLQPTGTEGYVVLAFEPHEAPISVNRTNGRHWSEVQTHKKLWEHAGFEAATNADDLLAPFRGKRVRLTFALPVARPGQCDAGNYVSGPSVKACQDGITRSRVLIPDDTSTWLETAVVFWKGPACRIKVEAIAPPEDPKAWNIGTP